MIKLKVIAEKLNIRNTPEADSTFANWVSDLNFGEEFVAEKLVKGKEFEHIDDWYIDQHNRFYWAGAATEVADVLAFNTQKMSWGFTGPDGLDVLTLWNSGLRGQNVRVAVLDSGINMDVDDLTGAIKDKTLDVKCFIPGQTIADDDGHGTACASIIAARGAGIYGAAPACELIVGKIANKATSTTTEITLAALKWACEERNADIISMSFSGIDVEPDVCKYIRQQAASPHNKIFIGSVSNAGEQSKTDFASPANCKGCISVGSYTVGRVACRDSGWNPNLFFISPGDKHVVYDLNGEKSILTCGTSFACPFTAGLMACLISFFKKDNRPYTASAIVDIMLSADCVNQVAQHNPLQHGRGIINPLKVFSKLSVL